MTKRGWCPSLTRPMPSGDGLLVRLTPAWLDAAALGALATAAGRFGNGAVQLTSRAAIQVRGLSDATLPAFTAALRDAGLAAPVRRVIPPPLAGDDPEVHPAAQDVAHAIESALADIDGLPAKFGVAIDAGGVCPTGDAGCPLVVLLGPAAATRAHPAIGWTRYVSGGGAFLLGLPFGATTAASLLILAGRLGACVLRPTPHRAFAVTGPAARAVGEAAEGFIADPGDPRLTIFACPGSPGCASATVPTRPIAEALARRRLPGTVHVSGCAKGCAHRGPADLTLIGAGGRFDLVRQGRAGDEPSRRGLSFAEAISA